MRRSTGIAMLSAVAAALVAIGSVGAAPTPALAATITVGAGDSIQAAINRASNGDTVNVQGGTHVENITIDKYISVVGNGATIQGAGGRTAVFFTNIPYTGGGRAQFSGFTVRGGNAPGGQGGGITVAINASPEIFGNTITGNNANAYGGGIAVHTNSNPIIRGNTISGNTAKDGGGGIFAALNSSPAIYGNTIDRNITAGGSVGDGSNGGGIYLENTADNNARSYPVVMNNQITNNSAQFAGGGIAAMRGVNAMIEGNTITGNTSSYGGGIHVETNGATVTITSNTVKNNAANFWKGGSGRGGGIAVYASSGAEIKYNTVQDNTSADGGTGIVVAEGASTQIVGNRIQGNQSNVGSAGNQEGGGVYLVNTTSTLINNQFIGNGADVGGGLAILGNTNVNVVNNTFVKNRETVVAGGAVFVGGNVTNANLVNNLFSANQGYQVFEDGSGSLKRIDNNLFSSAGSDRADRGSGLYFSYAANVTAANGFGAVPAAHSNIDTDPGFTNAGGNDFSLTGTSSAVNKGTSSNIPAVPDDFRNAVRASAPLDIGAFEYEAAPVVKQHVYRFWSDSKRAHFYTIAVDERNQVVANYNPGEWRYEGIAYDAFQTQVPGTIPLFRFYSQTFNGHFYTASSAERDYVDTTYSDRDWRFEGTAYYVYPLDTRVASREVFRFWSPDARHHFYTASQAESDYVRRTFPANTWTFEGPNFRVPQ